MPQLDRLNSLWVGDTLGYIEQISISSALAVGHPFTLYSYNPETLSGVPKGATVRDAREIMSDSARTRFFDIGCPALGSDFFRYAILNNGLGFSVDLDLEFIKPLSFTDQYVFGWERDGSINGAVLKLPTQSAIMAELSGLPKKNWKPPFYGPKRSAHFYWMRLKKGEVYPEDLAWGAYGPELITYLAKKYGVASRAQEKFVFYPIGYFETQLFTQPPENVEKRLSPSTCTVHFWHSRLADPLRRSAPRGSYLEAAAIRYGSIPACQ